LKRLANAHGTIMLNKEQFNWTIYDIVLLLFFLHNVMTTSIQGVLIKSPGELMVLLNLVSASYANVKVCFQS